MALRKGRRRRSLSLRVCVTGEIQGKRVLMFTTASDKQVRLLSQEAGHFSLIRALHAADYITELNGTYVLSITYH